jgi:hypothetical protein
MENPILKYQHNPELILENAGHSFRYYGVDREPNQIAIKEIEDFLSDEWEDFHKFCNFKTNKDGTMSIRFLSHWSPMFIGVSYERVDDLFDDGEWDDA